MSDIFVSYSDKDRGRILPIIEELKARGRTVWWDKHIQVGRTFDEVIEEEIGKATCVLVVWSADSVKSRWVRAEAEVGATKGNLFPILIDGVTIPIAFRQIQAAKLTGWKGDKSDPTFIEIIDSINSLFEGQSSSEPPPKDPSEKPTNLPFKKAGLLIIAIFFVVTLASVSWVIWTRNSQDNKNEDPGANKYAARGNVNSNEINRNQSTDDDPVEDTQDRPTSVMLTAELRKEYNSLFNELVIKEDRKADVESIVAKITENKTRYKNVERLTGVPWHVVAVIHYEEMLLDFGRHLENGDPLTDRTVHVPAGRPKEGNPPFTWEASAIDCVRLHRLDKRKDWSISGTLYVLEDWNGFGYRKKHPEILTPYLWAGSNQYAVARFAADGRFDTTGAANKIGAAVILKKMKETGVIEINE